MTENAKATDAASADPRIALIAPYLDPGSICHFGAASVAQQILDVLDANIQVIRVEIDASPAQRFLEDEVKPILAEAREVADNQNKVISKLQENNDALQDQVYLLRKQVEAAGVALIEGIVSKNESDARRRRDEQRIEVRDENVRKLRRENRSLKRVLDNNFTLEEANQAA